MSGVHGSPRLLFCASMPIRALLPNPWYGPLSPLSTWLHRPLAPTTQRPERERNSGEVGAGAGSEPVTHRTCVSPASVDVRALAVAWQITPRSGPHDSAPRTSQPGYVSTSSPAARSTSGSHISLIRSTLPLGLHADR